MKHWTRVHGSQRPSAAKSVTFEANFAGQGGLDCLVFMVDGIYHCIKPESIEDVRELQSQAAILACNFKGKANED